MYRLVDPDPVVGVNFYRLIAYNESGQIDARKLIAVDYYTKYFDLINIGPIPTVENLEILFSSNAEEPITIEILDLLGRKQMENSYEPKLGDNKLSLNLTELHAGVYFLKIRSEIDEEGILTKIVKR